MRHNNYSLSILATSGLMIAYSIAMILLHGLGDLPLPTWLLGVLNGSNIILGVSHGVAAMGYTFRAVDCLTGEITLWHWLRREQWWRRKHKNPNAKTNNGQFYGSVMGIGLALAFTLTMAACHAIAPGISGITEFFGILAGLTGLCSRTGEIYNNAQSKKNTFFRHPNINYMLGVIGGASVGLILAIAVTAIIGATSALTFGGAAPAWLGVSFFLLGTMGSGASAGGYIGRCFDYFLRNRTVLHKAPANRSPRAKRLLDTCEKRWTVYGISLGAVFGIAAAVALTTTGFGAVLGVPLWFGVITCLMSGPSIWGGLGNRIGAAWDRQKEKPKKSSKIELMSFPKSPIVDACSSANKNKPSLASASAQCTTRNIASKLYADDCSNSQNICEIRKAAKQAVDISLAPCQRSEDNQNIVKPLKASKQAIGYASMFTEKRRHPKLAAAEPEFNAVRMVAVCA